MNKTATQLTISRGMTDPRRGGRVRLWDTQTKRYRWFFSVDAIEHINRGTCILAVDEQGRHLSIDPQTGQAAGVVPTMKRKYALNEYSFGELQQMAQQVGLPFVSVSQENLIMRLQAVKYEPDFTPQTKLAAEEELDGPEQISTSAEESDEE